MLTMKITYIVLIVNLVNFKKCLMYSVDAISVLIWLFSMFYRVYGFNISSEEAKLVVFVTVLMTVSIPF